MGGEHDLDGLGQRRPPLLHPLGEGVDVGLGQMPRTHHAQGDVDAPRFAGPLLVVAHAEARVVRRQHDADDRAAADAHELGHGVLDERWRVLHAEGGAELPVALKGGGDAGLLRSRAFEQRRRAADGVVAAPQVGELVSCGRPAAAHMGVVGLDVV